MARDTYELSDETRKVLSHNPQMIAEEMGKHPSHVYDYLEMRQTDIFAKFLPLYNASVRAGAPVCHWDNRLAASRSRYEKIFPTKTTLECLKDKLAAQNQTIIKLYEVLEDGKLSETEIRGLQELINKEMQELLKMNTHLVFELGLLGKK